MVSHVKINLMARGIPRKASPLCVVTTSTPERQDRLKSLNDGGETIQNTINAVGGMFNCKTASKVVTVTDEADLAKQLAQAELENADLFGDDDDDEQERRTRDEAEEVQQVQGDVPDHWDSD